MRRCGKDNLTVMIVPMVPVGTMAFVGTGLLANASDHSPLQRLTCRLRQQAGSHSFLPAGLHHVIFPTVPVGTPLPALRASQSHASFAPTGTTTFGFLNTSTFPAITNTRPISAGAVHW